MVTVNLPVRERWTLKIPSYSDRELLSENLNFENPENIANLKLSLPDENQALTYIGHFELDRVTSCSFGSGHRPRRGYVLRGDDNNVYLVGHDCGKNELGLNFEEMSARYGVIRSRRRDLVRFTQIANVLRECLPGLNEMKDINSISKYMALRSSLEDNYKELHRQLKISAPRASYTVIVRERDTVEERKRMEAKLNAIAEGKGYYEDMSEYQRRDMIAYERQRGVDPVFANKEKSLGPMRGSRFFEIPQTDINKRINTAVSTTEAISSSMNEAILNQSTTTHDSEKLILNLSSIEKNLREIFSGLNDGAEFFEIGNLSLLVEFANHNKIAGFPFKLSGGKMKDKANQSVFKFGPDVFIKASLSCLDKLRGALDAR